MSAIWMASSMLSGTAGDKQAAQDVISAPQGGQGQTFIVSPILWGEMLPVRHWWYTSVCISVRVVRCAWVSVSAGSQPSSEVLCVCMRGHTSPSVTHKISGK